MRVCLNCEVVENTLFDYNSERKLGMSSGKKSEQKLKIEFSTGSFFHCDFIEKPCGKHIYFSEKRYHVAITPTVIYNSSVEAILY